MEKPGKCLDCGEPLSGRRDKKFCSDSCRVNYHNGKNISKNREIRSIYSILLRNRNILMKLWEQGNRVTDKDKLLMNDFNFTYHTHVQQAGKTIILGIFDFCLHFRQDNRIGISCSAELKP